MHQVSKPVRISDYLHAELERLAERENRSLANMVQVLLEQAIKLENATGAIPPRSGAGGSGVDRSATKPARVEPPALDTNPRELPGRPLGPISEKSFTPDWKPVSTKKKR